MGKTREYPNKPTQSRSRRKLLAIVGCAFLGLPLAVQAQSFSSGSTGANGALDLATMNCPNDVCVVQLPESGILNYTTVSVPSGKTLNFKSNSRNTPVVLLAQGNVTISGWVKLDASGIIPGPGGFYGGQTGPGFGPGGGTDSSRPGKWIGPLSLVPIVGGSGGASADYFGTRYPGGGGGGAIVIASSTAITVTNTITASGYPNAFNGPSPGGGSGGAIRLVANSLTVSGNLGACTGGFGNSGCGVVRLEATSLTFTGSSSPAAVLSTINPTVYSSALPQLTIAQIGGFAVPSYAGGRFDTVDLLLPSQLSDPISVSVHASNIPVGTQVDVGFVAGSNQATSTPGALSGTFESSSATCTISGVNRNSVTYLLATAIFEPPTGAMRFNSKGSDYVAKVRLESAIGSKPKFLFLRKNGTVIDQAKLPKKFLEQFGL